MFSFISSSLGVTTDMLYDCCISEKHGVTEIYGYFLYLFLFFIPQCIYVSSLQHLILRKIKDK